MAGIKRLFETECMMCNTSIPKKVAQEISVNGRVYTICKKCALDVECFMHQPPRMFGDLPVEVNNT